MNARVHHGVALGFVAALGLPACTRGQTGEETKPTPVGTTPGKPTPTPGTGTPGTTTPGTGAPGTPGTGTPSGRGRGGAFDECVGPSRLDVAGRERLADQICEELAAPSGGQKGVRSRCASAFSVRSDAQIAGVLSAWNEALVQQGAQAARDASDPEVIGFAHLVERGATHLRDAQIQGFRGLAIMPEANPIGRSLADGVRAELASAARGESFDRELVARQIEEQHRGLMMVDALGAQARDERVRRELESTRILTATELDQACWIWSGMSATHEGARGRGGQASDRGNVSGQGQATPGQRGSSGPSTGQVVPGQGPSSGQVTPGERRSSGQVTPGQGPSPGQATPGQATPGERRASGQATPGQSSSEEAAPGQESSVGEGGGR